MISSKKKKWNILADWDEEISVNLKDEDKFWDLDLKGSLEEIDENCIWNTAIDDYYSGKDWNKMVGNGPKIPVMDYYFTVYPAVAIGDIVEVIGTQDTAVVINIGENGMGDEAYQIEAGDGVPSWVARPQLRKVL